MTYQESCDIAREMLDGDASDVTESNKQLNTMVVRITPLIESGEEEGYVLEQHPEFEPTQFIVGDEEVDLECNHLENEGVTAYRYQIFDELGKERFVGIRELGVGYDYHNKTFKMVVEDLKLTEDKN